MGAGGTAGRLALAAALPVLGGCGFLGGGDGVFRDRSGDYREARIIPPMAIPGELDSHTIDELYVIPEAPGLAGGALDEVPMPKPIETRRREGVVLQSLSDKRWILIDATPGQVWPLVRDYWTSLRIALDREDPGGGVMETAWVEMRTDRERRHKYRIAIEPGLHSGYSEIYVLHLQQPRADPLPEAVPWPPASSSEDMETQMLRSVSQYLADRNDIYQASSASLLAGTIEAERKANIVPGAAGGQMLELRVDYDRAWAQVRQALENAEVDIVEADRERSLISVRFAGAVEEEERPGFFGRLFGRGGGGDAPAERGFSVRLLRAGAAVNVVAEALEAAGEADAPGEVDALALDLLRVINDNLS